MTFILLNCGGCSYVDLFMFLFLFFNHSISIHGPGRTPPPPKPCTKVDYTFRRNWEEVQHRLTPRCLMWAHVSELHQEHGTVGKTQDWRRKSWAQPWLCWAVLTESVNTSENSLLPWSHLSPKTIQWIEILQISCHIWENSLREVRKASLGTQLVHKGAKIWTQVNWFRSLSSEELFHTASGPELPFEGFGFLLANT